MQTVLFLCSGNFYRSRFAEHVFNFEAARRSMAWRAESRGFRLQPRNIGPLSPHTLDGLQALDIEVPPPHRFPLVASEADLATADLVIAVKEAEHRPLASEKFPAWVDRIEYWHVHDVDCAEPTAALPQLRSHVLDLMTRLAG
jgi:protein-tyrosine phosphatase